MDHADHATVESTYIRAGLQLETRLFNVSLPISSYPPLSPPPHPLLLQVFSPLTLDFTDRKWFRCRGLFTWLSPITGRNLHIWLVGPPWTAKSKLPLRGKAPPHFVGSCHPDFNATKFRPGPALVHSSWPASHPQLGSHLDREPMTTMSSLNQGSARSSDTASCSCLETTEPSLHLTASTVQTGYTSEMASIGCSADGH